MIICIVEAVLVVAGLIYLPVRERRMKRRESELTQKYIREGMTEDSARLRVFLETSPFVIREGTFEPPAGTLGERNSLGLRPRQYCVTVRGKFFRKWKKED